MAKQLTIEKRWYSKQEAALYLGFSERYIDLLRETNQITFRIKTEGGKNRVYFERQHLDDYMERNFKKIECITDFKKTLRK